MLTETLGVVSSIIASSTITGIIVKFLSDKKLEKYKMQLKINELFLSSLITALNLLTNDCKLIVRKSEEIRNEMENSEINPKSIDDLKALKQQYENTLRAYRIYLSRLIPYGKTDTYAIRYDDIKLVAAGYLLRLLLLAQSENDEKLIEKYKDGALRAIHYVNLSYESVCEKMNTIIEYLHKGINPFSIRWSEVGSDDWLDIAEEMHRELLAVEFPIDEAQGV